MTKQQVDDLIAKLSGYLPQKSCAPGTPVEIPVALLLELNRALWAHNRLLTLQ